ncbi:MAG: galactokinase family protein [Bacteroidota bacterium]
MKDAITIIAPGRICLFGDHQDYLGLPVIACAIDRQVVLTSEENTSGHFHIRMPDIHSERSIPVFERFENLTQGDHFASVLRVVRRYGCTPDHGYNITLKSTIPINAGTSSSSAIVVAWTHFLLKAFGCRHEITPQFIARLTYEAEVLEHDSPGGKMDQYTISLGNIIHIDTDADFSVRTVGTEMKGLVLGESGIPKETIGLLGELRGKAETAIDAVAKHTTGFNLKNTQLHEVEALSTHLSKAQRPYFYAAVKNHTITQQALMEFEKEQPDMPTLGRLMTEHHKVLRDILKITVPLIDKMIDAALEAGALGAKIVGSGGGGSIVAIAPEEDQETICNAIKSVGAKDAYSVSVGPGTYSK